MLAQIAWLIAVQYQRKGKRFSIDDFMPVPKPKKRMTNEQIQASLNAFFTQQKIVAQHGKSR